ncbi:thiamine-phosphate kinase [Methylophaga sp. SB9B]|uniref:thiamine-phosphate kinase n=1 Tax=Methylophaga sp. SB9B TaxID=2570356 RepID=UPI0010A825D5|nr:thiamine-phosphate kinase [Methylophaga sp. SB9B]THK43381.1 thiamine-phosphate kinase [Methylophaga sp. SB9B]
MKKSPEFSLIQQYFHALTANREDVIVGIGDDCAVLNNPQDFYTAISIDTLVQGIHFFADVDPYRLGIKSLAVNLSDLAAMGAEPAWFTLALTLPEINDEWLKQFSAGLADIAQQHRIQLVGGDTTRGPLTITIQVHGHLAKDNILQRNAAQTADLICVTGCLGDAAAGLKYRLGQLDTALLNDEDVEYLLQRLEMPTPRNQIGQQLVGQAHAVIDVSDGLLADLNHIVTASNKGAKLNLSTLPFSSVLQKLPLEQATQLALTGGDDYELCFTAPAENVAKLKQQFPKMIRVIGEITQDKGMYFQNAQGEWQAFSEIKAGYDHFA